MEEILKYQQLDSSLLKLERTLKSSEEKKIMKIAITNFKELQNKSLELEKLANSLAKEYETIKKEYDDCFKKLQSVTSLKSETLSEKELNDATKKVNEISAEFFIIERKLNQIVIKMKETLKDFENIKNNVIKTRAKHKESKQKYEELEKKIQPEIEKTKKEMQSLESKIDKKLLERYKARKADNIFPVFVPIANNLCGACHMEQPKAKIDVLKKDGFIVCEHCGRIIYNS